MALRRYESGEACRRTPSYSLTGECYAVTTAAAVSRPSSLTEISRISTFRILPVTVIGNPSQNRM